MQTFVNTPIRLNLYNGAGEIVQKYIFIGDVEEDIKKCIISIQNNKNNLKSEKILKEFYGKHWKTKLGLIDNIKGGKEFDEDEKEEISLEEVKALSEIFETPEISQPLQNKDLIKTQNLTKKKNLKDKESKKEYIKKIKYIFDEFNLYSFDTILEFKEKISTITNIPIFKQNIWYSYNKTNYNLNYNIFVNDKVVNINILDNLIFNKNTETINDIPVLMNFYSVKNLIKIKTYDTSSILENIVFKLGVVEFNMMNMDEFITSSNFKKDEIEIIYYGNILLFWPMMTHSAWIDYIEVGNDNFQKMYPDLLLDVNKNIKKYDYEKKITEEAYDLFNNKDRKTLKKSIEDNIYVGITSSIIQVTSFYDYPILNIRNLFDKIELNKDIIACKCSIIYEGRHIIMHKTYMNNEQIKANIPIKSILFYVKVLDSILEIYLFNDGNINIKSKWPEEKLYGFTDIFNIVSTKVNDFISKINKMGSYVIQSSFSLEKMSNKNSRFSELYLSIIYRKYMKFYEFKLIEKILEDYTKAGIFSVNKLDQVNNLFEYYFNKGAYIYDISRIEKNMIVNNYYAFLTNSNIKNRWEQLFVLNRNTKFQYRQGDVKITIEDIKEQEFGIFYMYIINIFALMESQKKHIRKEEVPQLKMKKNIKNLKYKDPILYDFKKIYNSQLIYSRLCQKKVQPLILTNDEYNALDKNKKDRVVNYWNFTTNTPALYYCPNPKYPYIQFIVKKHPKDFCIPCCKIKSIDESDQEIKKLIYKTCMEEHKYKKEKQNIIVDTRYIMSYGKQISLGRLSNLPEESIEPLLYESFSDSTTGVEPKCKNKFYIYGIEQNTLYINDIGYVASLAFSLDLTIKELCQKVIKLIIAQPNKFKVILDGKIISYFKTINDLIKGIEVAFININEIEIPKNAPWTDIFVDIAYYYLHIHSIIFDDRAGTGKNVKINISNRFNTSIKLLNPDYKNMLIMRTRNEYYPIFNINSIVYFKTKLIDKKLFDGTDSVMSIISNVVEFSNKEKLRIQNKLDITLETYTEFIKDTKIYKIKSYFINKNNLCYYIEFTKNQKSIYIPVIFSYYTDIDNVNVIYDPFLIKKYKTSFSLINTFIKDFNHWIAIKSEKMGFIIEEAKKYLPLEQRVHPIYEYIRVDKWLYLDNPWNKSSSKIIGFIHNNINYYHDSIELKFAKKLKNTQLERILYHPDEINYNLSTNKKIIDNNTKNLPKQLYDYHLYELLILEFTELLNREKNLHLRHLIKKELIKNIDLDSSKTIEEIDKLIQNYYKKYISLNESLKVLYDIIYNEDISKLTTQINNYVIEHKNKKLLLSYIDSSVYNFDKIKINELRTMKKDILLKELKKISDRVVNIVQEKEIEKKLQNFPNILISCQDKQIDSIYCKKNKLVITKQKLDELLEIMASDILNPFKQKWLFNVIFTKNIIQMFKFIRRSNEYIEIYSA